MFSIHWLSLYILPHVLRHDLVDGLDSLRQEGAWRQELGHTAARLGIAITIPPVVPAPLDFPSFLLDVVHGSSHSMIEETQAFRHVTEIASLTPDHQPQHHLKDITHRLLVQGGLVLGHSLLIVQLEKHTEPAAAAITGKRRC